MSFTYNGTEVQGVTYNGSEVQSITYNGVEVWSAFKVEPNLKDNTPEQIQYAAQHDLAASLWDIGDWFEMTLKGNWQGVYYTIKQVNNYVIRCVLIGINHNADKEGNHLLHFQMGKDTNNVDVAFYTSKMNNQRTNSGGWKSCEMRTITMANLYNTIIPSNWRAVIKPCTKYTDNTGGGSNNASYVTATSDNCFLLAEYEVFGSRSYANSAEKNYQKQYAYYANGNSKVRRAHIEQEYENKWWLRSVYCGDSEDFCRVSGSGGQTRYYANYAEGVSPTFCIG